MRTIPLLLSALLIGGCTSYRYSVDTGENVLLVKKDQDLVLRADPAELRLRQVESRCVVLVANPTSQPFEIDGGGSAIVDPRGQSRGIAPQLVPPGSYVKYVLPPLRDQAPRGPSFGIGLGVLVQAPATGEMRKPVYLDIGPRNMEYWEWDGAGTVKLILSLKQNRQMQQHTFVLRREKQ